MSGADSSRKHLKNSEPLLPAAAAPDAKRFSRRHRFSDWPNRELPDAAAGVYAIWDGSVLIYAGMSGRQLEKRVVPLTAKCGLVTRLASHAAGRLSGDQFCVYVANRFVIPALLPDQMQRFSGGDLTLDMLTRAYIHRRLEYQFALVSSGSEAYLLEKKCCEGSVFGVRPLLNARGPRRTSRD